MAETATKATVTDNEDVLKPYVIGLDLGGTNSVFGIVDTRGVIKATTAIKTQGYGNNVQAYVDAAVDALQIIIDQVGGISKIKAMGIGAPNGNYYNGTYPNLAAGLNAGRCVTFGMLCGRQVANL